VRVMSGSEMLSIWTTPINEKGEGTTLGIKIHTHAFIHTYTQKHTNTHLHTPIHIHTVMIIMETIFFCGREAMKLFLNAKVMIIPLIRMIFSSCGKGGLELFALHFSFFLLFCLYRFFLYLCLTWVHFML